MLNRNFVVNASKDCRKIDEFAMELAKRLGLTRMRYRRWEVVEDRFYIVGWLSECGCEDSYYFPLDWLDIPKDEIVSRWREDMAKPLSKRVIGND